MYMYMYVYMYMYMYVYMYMYHVHVHMHVHVQGCRGAKGEGLRAGRRGGGGRGAGCGLRVAGEERMPGGRILQPNRNAILFFSAMRKMPIIAFYCLLMPFIADLRRFVTRFGPNKITKTTKI